MSSPVKTRVLDQLEVVVGAATGVNEAVRHPSAPIDLDDFNVNKVFLFDEDETTAERNRKTRKTFTLHTECWTRQEGGMKAISDAADLLQANITAALLTDATLRTLSIRVREANPCAAKFYHDEEQGGVILRYEITYEHTTHDLTKINP